MARADAGPILGLDSATPFLALALWWPAEDRTANRSLRVDRRLAGLLPGTVDAFLRDHGLAAGDLAGLGIGVGPGSFTGVRVALAFGAALRRATGLRWAAGDSMAALAMACLADGEQGWVAVDGRRGQAQTAPWRRDGDRLSRLEPLRSLPLGELSDDAAASRERAPDALHHAKLLSDPDAPEPQLQVG